MRLPACFGGALQVTAEEAAATAATGFTTAPTSAAAAAAAAAAAEVDALSHTKQRRQPLFCMLAGPENEGRKKKTEGKVEHRIKVGK